MPLHCPSSCLAQSVQCRLMRLQSTSVNNKLASENKLMADKGSELYFGKLLKCPVAQPEEEWASPRAAAISRDNSIVLRCSVTVENGDSG